MRANSSFKAVMMASKRMRVYDIQYTESGEFSLICLTVTLFWPCSLPYNSNMLKVAAIQMVSSDQLEENLEQAAELVDEAAAAGATLLTLPENFPLMSKEDTDRLAIAEDLGNGPIQDFLANSSRQHGIWLLGGTIPIRTQNRDKVFASSMLFNPKGECIAHYNKIHLFDVVVDEANTESYRESDTFEAGNDIVVAKTDVGNIGLSVCYDLRFPELYRKMHEHNVQIITSPSAFTATTGEAHWETLIRGRAIENLCYVIASNQGGTHANGRETWGHSMIVDPWGHVLDLVDYGSGIAFAEIDLEKQERLRSMFPSLTHRRLDYQLND